MNILPEAKIAWLAPVGKRLPAGFRRSETAKRTHSKNAKITNVHKGVSRKYKKQKMQNEPIWHASACVHAILAAGRGTHRDVVPFSALGTMYPHLVTSQKAGMCYSIDVVGRDTAVDRVQTSTAGRVKSEDFERLFSLRPE